MCNGVFTAAVLALNGLLTPERVSKIGWDVVSH